VKTFPYQKYGCENIPVSKVEITKLIDKRVISFEIYSRIKNPDIGYLTNVEYYNDGVDTYEDTLVEIHGLYKEVVYVFTVDNNPPLVNGYKHVYKLVIECSGNVVNICSSRID
jgi:hypothetical protein